MPPVVVKAAVISKTAAATPIPGVTRKSGIAAKTGSTAQQTSSAISSRRAEDRPGGTRPMESPSTPAAAPEKSPA